MTGDILPVAMFYSDEKTPTTTTTTMTTLTRTSPNRHTGRANSPPGIGNRLSGNENRPPVSPSRQKGKRIIGASSNYTSTSSINKQKTAIY